MSPQKILHVASRSDFHLGNRCYGLPYKINNGFVKNGHNVVWFSDRDVAKNASVIPARSFGRKKCNKNFLEYCKNFRPEIIAICSPTLLEKETLLAAREILPGAIIFQYNIDGLYIGENVQKIAAKSSAVDWTFSTTAGPILNEIASQKSPAAFIPNPVDPSIDRFKNFQNSEFEYDILYIGGRASWDAPDDIRVVAVDNIRTDLSEFRILISDQIWGDNYLQSFKNSKMVLSFNHRPVATSPGKGGPLYMCSSDRISFCMGNGLLTFVNNMFSLSDLYGDGCLVEVSGYDELLEKIRYYHANDSERKQVAHKAHTVAHTEFNNELVTRYMLETVLGKAYSHDYRWPTDHYFG